MGTFNERKDFIIKQYRYVTRGIKRELGIPSAILRKLASLELSGGVEISRDDKIFLLYRGAISPHTICAMYYNVVVDASGDAYIPILGIFEYGEEMKNEYLCMEGFILSKEDRNVWVEGEVLDTSGQFIKLKDYRTNEIAVTKLPHVSGSMNVIINKGESVRVFDNGDVEKFGPPLIIPLGTNGGLYKSEPC